MLCDFYVIAMRLLCDCYVEYVLHAYCNSTPSCSWCQLLPTPTTLATAAAAAPVTPTAHGQAIEYCGSLCKDVLAAVGANSHSVVACRARKDQKVSHLPFPHYYIPTYYASLSTHCVIHTFHYSPLSTHYFPAVCHSLRMLTTQSSTIT